WRGRHAEATRDVVAAVPRRGRRRWRECLCLRGNERAAGALRLARRSEAVIGELWIIALGLCGALLFVAGVLHVPITAATAIVAILVSCVAAGCLVRRRPNEERV